MYDAMQKLLLATESEFSVTVTLLASETRCNLIYLLILISAES